jgi:CheY-like chemotaxis protein
MKRPSLEILATQFRHHGCLGMTVVLIVEDEFLQRECLRGTLNDAGYAMVTADNADEAVEILTI